METPVESFALVEMLAPPRHRHVKRFGHTKTHHTHNVAPLYSMLIFIQLLIYYYI